MSPPLQRRNSIRKENKLNNENSGGGPPNSSSFNDSKSPKPFAIHLAKELTILEDESIDYDLLKNPQMALMSVEERALF